MITMAEGLLLFIGFFTFLAFCGLIWGLNELRKIRKAKRAEENNATK